MIVDKQEENRVKYFVDKKQIQIKIFYILLNTPTNKWKYIKKKLESLNKMCVGIPPYLRYFRKFKIVSKILKLNQCKKQPPRKIHLSNS